MIRVILHILIMPAMLLLERRGAPRLTPSRAALIWYLLGVPLIIVEASAAGRDWPGILLQSLIIALFFLPPVYFAFRFARRFGGIWRPFLLYLALSFIAGLAVAAFLAHAPYVLGNV